MALQRKPNEPKRIESPKVSKPGTDRRLSSVTVFSRPGDAAAPSKVKRDRLNLFPQRANEETGGNKENTLIVFNY